MTAPHDHLDPERDLDEIADVLAGETAAPDCATCAAVVAELEAASAVVTAALGALPVPAPPDDLAARIDAALREAVLDAEPDRGLDSAASGQATVTTLPTLEGRAPRGPRRWLPAAAAAVVLTGGGLLAAQTLPLGAGDSADEAATAMTGAGEVGGRDLVRNDSGNAYTEANLASAVPGLLTGQVPRHAAPPVTASAPLSAPGAATDSGTTSSGTTGGGTTGGTSESTARGQAQVPAARPVTVDPLAALRTTPGLAACLAALLPPDDDSVQPLALDYGTFSGKPALLVLLPVPQRSDKVDVFVVGAGCAQADEQLLFFQRVDRPS
ncbi:MAG: hypothetical protein Q8R60_17560 [Mycobacteriales bacterium]|nr:hypothetical protein [Mycobacteriales bacterium]